LELLQLVQEIVSLLILALELEAQEVKGALVEQAINADASGIKAQIDKE
jgi:hypothetical protein